VNADSRNANTLIEVRNLDVTFLVNRREVPILRSVSFDLSTQQTLGIVGESGSGKSVTALSILKLIPSPPLHGMSGEVLFRGSDLMSLPARELRTVRGAEISFIFQEPMTALNPVLTIGRQISETMRAHMRISKKEAGERTVELLKEVGMPDPQLRARSYPHELSGGMRQRAMTAMALSCDPSVLIADEPTTALDVTIQAQILELFKKLRDERRMSIIFITHDLGVIAEIADQVLVMQEGAVVEYGPVEDIFHSPSHPYTRKLLGFLPGRNRRHAAS
jgi:ABC-type dipeptide/oligopeptide/nickel transport system ATPase component